MDTVREKLKGTSSSTEAAEFVSSVSSRGDGGA
jgi:hypothetical protein